MIGRLTINRPNSMHDSQKILQKASKILDDLKAIDIIVIDITEQTTISDHMLICTARSSRHVKAMGLELINSMKGLGIPVLNINGHDSIDWALLDFGYFIVNIMQAETRAHYNLEGLWLKKDQNNHYVKNNAH